MTRKAERVRFAPSPTGSLHLGNARTALFNWLVAKRSGGAFVLRIEDTDIEREQEGSESGIFQDLRWLGLDWDEGPDAGGQFGPYRQSERGPRYLAAAGHLLQSGRAYRCFCSDATLEADREAMRASGRTPTYSGRCHAISPAESDRRSAAGEPHAIRFHTLPAHPAPSDLVVAFRDRLRGDLEFSTAELGDPVLLRRDGRPTYNFAVVVDDEAMKISLVIRGDDHLSNTPRQVLFYRAFGWETPEFAHLPMVRGADGERLSKRHGATSVAEYRRQGVPPDGLLNALALLGWAPDGDRSVLARDELVREFDLDRVGASPAVFDSKKLEWLSGQHLHKTPLEVLAPQIGRFLVESGRLPAILPDGTSEWLIAVAEMARSAVASIAQAVDRCAALFFDGSLPEIGELPAVIASPAGRLVLHAMRAAAREGEPIDATSWNAFKERVKRESGQKGKDLFHPMRAAITGELSGPELDRLVPLIVEGSRLFPGSIPALRARIERAAGATP